MVEFGLIADACSPSHFMIFPKVDAMLLFSEFIASLNADLTDNEVQTMICAYLRPVKSVDP